MKVYGNARTGGSSEQKPIPYPIGKGVSHVTPLPPVAPKKPAPDRTPAAMARRDRDVREAYQAGELVRVIANRHGISRTRVYGLLKDGGIDTRKASE